MNVIIVYAEPEELNGITNKDIPIDSVFLDQNSLKTRREAFRVKGSVAAKLTPLCVIKDDNKFVKAFYKEESKDPIKAMIDWLNNNINNLLHDSQT